ncbi:unnamed protein product [Protopolystoma xenopodis]|uniref:Uncharacterized protein n=1 Tax=Protopolystoma xenopodis TaxID=117903 RepID=A0A3S5FDD2_9PLAT|nr:unnamed protein product [Protopolystoma xenopodis]
MRLDDALCHVIYDLSVVSLKKGSDVQGASEKGFQLDSKATGLQETIDSNGHLGKRRIKRPVSTDTCTAEEIEKNSQPSHPVTSFEAICARLQTWYSGVQLPSRAKIQQALDELIAVGKVYFTGE